MNQWESIYAELDQLLSHLPFARAASEATYLIVDYGDRQHKIECFAAGFFEPDVLGAVQAILRRHASDWEVILVGGPKLGPQQAVSIFPDAIVPRWSTAQWYEDDDK